ncbi:nitrilase-related carbon-nitrogen hydrolase [Actinotalea sp. Marseille-Q4924]|uniref:nitrilase-related carbon-nitrogen hydrolase n=1 Tax=Actinotalea sp. Marseille-Q4924 TaxID=2866571 RepID=UPI001CE3DA36|nr:nitrilase-related carbon-nitrogen hydrolase [Actinotalea sp. Marseille-Q4924]
MELVTAFDPPQSPARTGPARGPVLRVGVVQHRWHADPERLADELAQGVALAAREGAVVVFLAELTLSRYPADRRGGPDACAAAEDLDGGPTVTLATRLAREHGVLVQASLYERADAPDGPDGLGYNTAVLVGPEGVVGRTRKLHIPVTAGYHEDTYFRPGPAAPDPFPVHGHPLLAGARLGMPTCWDEWFGEVARAYALADADLLVYPTAIGSEPDHPGFDTEPLWRQVVVGHGIENGLFMVVPNRWGAEGLITFYGSSFVSDPYGRVLARAPRDASAVLVVDLDLQQRQDWLTLFPFLRTRRPDAYGLLTHPVVPERAGDVADPADDVEPSLTPP